MAGYVGNVPVPQSVREDQSFTATAGQTTFNTLGYTDGNRIKVTLNGVLLEGGGVDYTATNGSDVVLTVGAAADDIVRFETFNEVNLVSSVTTTPTFKTSATLLNETEEDIEGGRESTLIFQGEQSGGELSTLAEIEASHDGTADDQKGDLIFRTNDGNDNTSPTERLRINSAGDMLFSSEDPSLTIANTTHEDTDGGRESTIAFQGEQSGGEISTLAQIEAAHDGTSDDEAGELMFRVNDGNDGTSPSEVMRINSLGNVGIGTANIDVSTQAGGSGYKALQIESDEGGQINFDHNDAGTGSTLGQINFQRAGEVVAEIEGVTDGATDSGRISFRTQPDGGALTERWRITHDGHLKAATDGIGIDFSAAETSSGVTIDDSLLDDYEQGTFNFEMVGYYGSSSPKIQIPAHYTKIGNTVHFWALKTAINNTGYSGNMWFTGLPFSAPSPYSIGNISLYFIGTYSGYGPHTLISGGTVYAVLHQSNASSWSAVMHNVVSSGGEVYMAGTYKV